MRTAKLLPRIQSKSLINSTKNSLNKLSSRKFHEIWQPRAQLHRFLLKEPLEPLFYHHPIQTQMSRELEDIHNQFDQCFIQSSKKIDKFLSNSTGIFCCDICYLIN